jgi:hypothetical protein
VTDLPPFEDDGRLPARLFELVQTVGVDRMSPATVQRRVKERARRRRLRRGLSTAALAAVAVIFTIGALTAQGPASGNQVVTRGPLVPVSPQVTAASGDPAFSIDATTTSTVTTPPTVAPASPTTTVPDVTGSGSARDGRDQSMRDTPTTRGADGNTAPRGN